MENIQNRIKIENIKKVDLEEILKQQSFNGIQKSYTNYYSYIIEQKEVFLDKPIFLGFATLELSKFSMYGTKYDKLQLYFGEKSLQLLYMDTDSSVLSVNTKYIVKDLKILKIYLISAF